MTSFIIIMKNINEMNENICDYGINFTTLIIMIIRPYLDIMINIIRKYLPVNLI